MVDFALISALQPYLPVDLCILLYNIMCQYIIRLAVHLDENFTEEMLSELKSIQATDIPDIIAGVGKYHLSMHTQDCRQKFSTHQLPCTCMDDGEPCERIWGLINAIAHCTKEMSAEYRHDTLNDVYNDQNIGRVHRMGEHQYEDNATEFTVNGCSVFFGQQTR